MARTIHAIRGDDPRLFGPSGRVRANRLFPLPSSYQVGVAVLDGRGHAFEELYAELGELLARADALDPDSETGRRIAEIDEQLATLEDREARELREAFEQRLHMPVNAGATLDDELADALRYLDDHRADDAASDESADPAT